MTDAPPEVTAGSPGDLLPAGACLLAAEPGPAWAARGSPAPAAYLYKLAVARFAAGRQIGHRLVAWAESWTRGRGLPRLRLDCWDGNEVLRRYYRDLGFEELEAATEGDFRVRLFEKCV
ncbi:MAG: GNAT family N-acetyltransferase [Proteobacteria bacterium]|nr:GNAT family N-acetyltransferase [Pseudomonadota bacterium]